MADISTNITVAGLDIHLGGEWVGEKSSSWSRNSSSHNIITISTYQGEESFDFWMSMMRPEFESSDDLISAFVNICDEFLIVEYDTFDDLVCVDEDHPYSHWRQVERDMQANHDRLMGIGIDEEIASYMVNSEEYEDYR